MKLFVIAVPLIYSLDQATKFWIKNILSEGESLPLIKNIFHLTLVYNQGTAFGVLKAYSTFLLFLSGLASLGLIILLTLKHKHMSFLERAGFSFILAGTLGNFTDRLYYGYVVDFLDFRVWPVFNIADSFITTGAILLVTAVIRREFSSKKNYVSNII
ncbi:lipoprotein signal peptidase [Candidatus Omnitrophus magneticus]|uniref:Lipoprotein signal peptidase n=1 Tax=Candidatus Omnitrophus magneticus TaxID=1609969 RepID=A0A0F0CP29_9BACT|nr:lipoprotein signal peptidase [Candidatus Omnitrophus magneticus]